MATLKAAEQHVRVGLSDYKGEPLIIFVSEETPNKFHQVQLKVVGRTPDAA